MNQWDQYAEQIRARLPTAPEPILDGYVKWIPWLAMVFGGFGMLLTLVGFVLGTILSPFLLLAGVHGIAAGAAAFVALLLLFIGSALDFAGGYLMLRRSLTGWWLVAVGIIIGLLDSIVAAQALGLLIALAAAYLHLSVKPRFAL